MTKLERLYAEYGQSPWLDNLTRGYLRDGTLARHGRRRDPRGDRQPDHLRQGHRRLRRLRRAVRGADRGRRSRVEDAYWQLVIDDITDALAVLRPVFDASGGTDGFVSVEVAAELARDTRPRSPPRGRCTSGSPQPNLFVKIPATAEGVPAVQAMIAEGRSINITLIFSLARYEQIIEAYLSGLESLRRARRRPVGVHSVASFFVSRVDTEVDRRLEARRHRRGARRCAARPRSPRPSWPTGCSASASPAAVAAPGRPRGAPATAAVGLDVHQEPGLPRHPLRRRAHRPRHVNTLPEVTIAAFEDHGTLARTIDTGVARPPRSMRRLAAAGVDMDDVGAPWRTRASPASTRPTKTY